MTTILLASIGAIWFLWIFYAAVMRLQQVRDAGKLTTAIKVFGYPTLLLGLVLDLLVNVVLGSIAFLELPRELTLSARLWRLSNDANAGWRQRFALWARTQLLDSIDPSGVHRG